MSDSNDVTVSSGDGLRPGAAVPDFRLVSLAGGPADLGSLRGRV